MLAFIKCRYKVKVYFGFWYTVWVKWRIMYKVSRGSFHYFTYPFFMCHFIYIKPSIFFSREKFYFVYRSSNDIFRRLNRCCRSLLNCWSCLSCWSSVSVCAFGVVFFCVSCGKSGTSVEVCFPSVNKE